MYCGPSCFCLVSELEFAQCRLQAASQLSTLQPEPRESGFDSTPAKEVQRELVKEKHACKYRVSPLVSDINTWYNRVQELQLLTKHDRAEDIVPKVRTLAFAFMNANIRANFTSEMILKEMIQIVKNNNGITSTEAYGKSLHQVKAGQQAQQQDFFE